jgi:hypothetical protein
MSDTQASMREFRFLDEQRKTNGLMPADEERWQALALSLGVDVSALQQPAQAPQGAYGADGQWYPAQPQGHYGPDGQWYQAAPQDYYQPQPQGYYGPDGQWYQAPPHGYAPQPQGAYGADGQWYPAPPQQPGWYDPAHQQPPLQHQPPGPQPWGQPQWEQRPPEGQPWGQPHWQEPQAPQPWGQPHWDAHQQQWVQPPAPQWDADQQQWVQPAAPEQQQWVEPAAPEPAQDWAPPTEEHPWPQPAVPEHQPTETHPQQDPGWSAQAQQPAGPPEPSARSPLEAAPAPEPQEPPDVTDEVMEIADEEVVEIPNTSPPLPQFQAAPAPAPVVAPVPTTVELPSDDPVAELRSALSLDDDEPTSASRAAEVVPEPSSGLSVDAPAPLAAPSSPAAPAAAPLLEGIALPEEPPPVPAATTHFEEPVQAIASEAPFTPPSSAPSYAQFVASRTPAPALFPDLAPLSPLEVTAAEPLFPAVTPTADSPDAAPRQSPLPPLLDLEDLPSPAQSVEPAPVQTSDSPPRAAAALPLIPEPVEEPPAALEAELVPVFDFAARADPLPLVPLQADPDQRPVEEPLEGAGPTDVATAVPPETLAHRESPQPEVALPSLWSDPDEGHTSPSEAELSAVVVPAAPAPQSAPPPAPKALSPASAEPQIGLDEHSSPTPRPVPSFEPTVASFAALEPSRVATPVEVPVFDASPPVFVPSAFAGLALPPDALPIPTFEAAPAPAAVQDSAALGGEWAPETKETGATDVVFASNWDEEPSLPVEPLGSGLEEATRPEVARLSGYDVTTPGVPMPMPTTVTGHEATSPAALLPNWDALEVSREPTSPGVPMPEWGPEESTPQARPAVTAPTEWGALPSLEGEAPLFEATLAGDPSEPVPLATNTEFLLGAVAPPAMLVEPDLSVEADLGEFVVESGSAAALATGVAESAASPFDAAPIQLATNAEFLSHPELISTGEPMRAPPSALSIEVEEEPLLEGEIIAGELEVDLQASSLGAAAPVGADSWAVALEPPAPIALAPRQPTPPPQPQPVPPPAPQPLAVEPTRPVVPAFLAPVAPVAVAPSPAAVVPGPVAGAFDLSAPLLRQDDDTPVLVTGEHRVILHTMEGGVKRGSICDVDLAGALVGLTTGPAAFEDVPRDRVKAIFFMLAPGSRAPAPEGTKVRVTFRDGRQVAGFSNDYKSTAIGFFVVPADNRTNTERIFIYRHAVSAVLPES